ncbi:MAG: hypothetical protein OYK82_15425 [Gammaproteobacteria bacterium]|nr:hypothetical protein [Gammaproteobacteria bacterium]
MNRTTVHQQFHGYRKGHQLLSASLVLDPKDQDAVDSLSDLTGGLRPGQMFDPYLTAYPLPSRTYYVLARTFQDREAPRPGCVLTRSLLVPMGTWVELNNVEWLVAMLEQIQEGEEARPRDKAAYDEKWPTRVSDSRVVEVVQALFLEPLRPIVVFNAPEADLIATRLLVALWPGLRRNFSICTLALGPRRLGDRTFDLVFAPITSRSRFSGEVFGRIGVRGSLPNEAVHPLAATVAKRVFQSDEPKLAVTDAIELMAKEQLCDRTAVRVILQWDELASRAKTTPTAVLGMLDIMNSLGGPGPEAWGRLDSVVSGALDLTAARSSPRESWNFLLALNAKVKWRTAPQKLKGRLESVARSLSRAAPEATLGAAGHLSANTQGSSALLRTVGDELAESQSLESLSDLLGPLTPNTLLKLVDASTRLNRVLATGLNDAVDRWLGTVVRMLKGGDSAASRRVRRRLVPLLRDSVVGESLPRILADVGRGELADLVVELGRSGRLRSEAMNAVVAEAVRRIGAVDSVRDAVVNRVQGGDAEAFLLNVVELTGADLDWLLGTGNEAVAGRLLTSLLEDAEDRAIHSVLSEHGRAPRVVSVLRATLPTSASHIARILRLGLMPGCTGLDVGFDAVPWVPPRERRSLQKWLLPQVLSATPPADPRVQLAIAESRHGLTAEELVVAAISTSIRRQRASENLVALNAAPPDVRDGVVRIVDEVARHLVERHWERLDEAAYRAFAEILADARTVDPGRRTRAASRVFAFALRRVSYPVSALVVAAFPVVYSERNRLRELDRIRKELFGISAHAWVSAKKPKDGRRKLIDALVSAFLRSSWPPADLVVTALEAGIGKRVVKRVRRRLLGARYVDRIRKDARRLDDDLRRRVLACVEDTD